MNTCETPDLMPVSVALTQMLSAVSPIETQEVITLFEACGRILAQDEHSPVNVPPHNNSAMDGYAINCQDLINSPKGLLLVGQSLAGKPYQQQWQTQTCVRVTTGAVMPKGSNAVVIQENAVLKDNFLQVIDTIKAGDNIRLSGEDIQSGQLIVEKSTSLSPAHLALLASIGVDRVSVYRKPKVALIATGDELVEPGNPLKEGQIYESNRYALQALLSKSQVDVQIYPIVKDKIEDIRKVFIEASQNTDLIISCGGVSVGVADYVKNVVAELGKVDFWKVAIKPGKPFAFGHIGKAVFCGLPGNPVSSYITYTQLVSQVVAKLCGTKANTLPLVQATTTAKIYKRSGRADYQRAVYTVNNNGQYDVAPLPRQGSGIMTSITQANCLIVLAQHQGNLPSGSQVSIQLL